MLYQSIRNSVEISVKPAYPIADIFIASLSRSTGHQWFESTTFK
jgi:hypothetical protein